MKTMLVVLTMGVVGTTPAFAAGPRFSSHDPVTRAAEEQDASSVRPIEIDHTWGGVQAILRRPADTRRPALDINSVGEVPDSSWFTNRIGWRRVSPAEIAKGPDSRGSAPTGRWTIVAAKTDGVTPGLQVDDALGRRFFVKFDPPSNPEMASGAEVVATKLLFALGYNVPENYVAVIRREDLTISANATFKGPDGTKRPMTASDIEQLLRRAARSRDGSYRVLASLRLEGTPVGPFQYAGTRADDPNDTVPHEHRRELRALRVFAAWLNHVDTKSQNSLDTLVHVDGRTIVRHHLIDFGSTLGSAGTEPKGWRDGYEYAFDSRTSLVSLVTLGAWVPSWLRIHYPHLPAVGRIDSVHFQPDKWKPTLPNPAFDQAQPDDLFWAAERVMAFSDDAIRAAVAEACFSDSAAAEYLAQVLIARRDRIGRAFMTPLNPIGQPAIDRRGELTFRNAAVDAGVADEARAYELRWLVFDNGAGTSTPLTRWASEGRSASTLPPVPASAEYIAVDIRAIHPHFPAWAAPVKATFRRGADGAWTTVGFERLERGN